MQTQRLMPSDGERDDWFGWYVALSDTFAFVCANQANINGDTNVGSVYVFNNPNGPGGLWQETQKLTASDAQEFGGFGWSVNLHGNIALIGSVVTESAYFFKQSRDGTWAEKTEIFPSDGSQSPGNAFGWSVHFDGQTALITAPFTEINGIMQGAAYFYQR